jgi:hypothetical protein
VPPGESVAGLPRLLDGGPGASRLSAVARAAIAATRSPAAPDQTWRRHDQRGHRRIGTHHAHANVGIHAPVVSGPPTSVSGLVVTASRYQFWASAVTITHCVWYTGVPLMGSTHPLGGIRQGCFPDAPHGHRSRRCSPCPPSSRDTGPSAHPRSAGEAGRSSKPEEQQADDLGAHGGQAGERSTFRHHTVGTHGVRCTSSPSQPVAAVIPAPALGLRRQVVARERASQGKRQWTVRPADRSWTSHQHRLHIGEGEQ